MRTLRTPAVAAISAALLSLPVAALAADAPGQQQDGHYSFAVIGDIPYGAAQVAAFPGWVDRINAESDLSLAFHVGDIKNGSTRCDDSYYSFIKGQFDRFRTPLVYTPGDNEWTDCHRVNNGAYQPLERLQTVRDTFFAQPGTTLGAKLKVNSQAALGFPENVALREQGVSMAVVHVVGSNNDLNPWTGIGNTAATPEQLAEEKARMEASVAEIRGAFATARQKNDRAVAVFMQADMFDPTYEVPFANDSAFVPLVRALVEESNSFDGPVYLFDGDSHIFNVDHPLATGSKWLDFYGVTGSAPNLTRVTVDGEAQNANGFLKVTVNRPGAASVLSWERVPYTS